MDMSVWFLMGAALVFFMQCGFAMVEAGFTRAKNVGNITMKNLMDFCMNHQLSMTNLLLLGIRTYLSKVNNGQEDITIQNFISRRSTNDEWI